MNNIRFTAAPALISVRLQRVAKCFFDFLRIFRRMMRLDFLYFIKNRLIDLVNIHISRPPPDKIISVCIAPAFSRRAAALPLPQLAQPAQNARAVDVGLTLPRQNTHGQFVARSLIFHNRKLGKHIKANEKAPQIHT